MNHFVAEVCINELLQRRAAIHARPEECTQPPWLQEVFSGSIGECIEKARVPGWSEKRVRSDQRAGADARHDREVRSRAGAREAGHSASAESAGAGAARERKDVERLPRPQCVKSLSHNRGRQLRKSMVRIEGADGHWQARQRLPMSRA